MKSKLLVLLCLFSMAFMLTSCGEKQDEMEEIEVEEGEEKPKPKKKKKEGFSLPWGQQEEEEEEDDEEVKRSPEDIMRDRIAEIKAAYEDKKAEEKETKQYMYFLLGRPPNGVMVHNNVNRWSCPRCNSSWTISLRDVAGPKNAQCIPNCVMHERKLIRTKQTTIQREKSQIKNKLLAYKSKLKRMLKAKKNGKKKKKRRK